MTLNIPSTCLRSKYLKKLPIGTCFVDPKSGYNYEIVEKKLNDTLVKVAVPYLASEKEPITLSDIPKEYLKLDTVPKANILKSMKNKLTFLQEENKRLLEQQQKTLYERIKECLSDCNYYETEELYYCLHSGLVITLKKKHYPTVKDALSILDESVVKLFKDSKLLQKTLSKQPTIQSTLHQLLTTSNSNNTKDENL